MRKILATIVALSLFLTPVMAQGVGTQQASGTPQAGNAQACSLVTQRMGALTERYEQNKERYMNTFERVFQNMTAVMEKLKANGVDTAKLEGDLTQYNKMIQNANRFYSEFQNGMENAKSAVCGTGNGNAAEHMTQAREQLTSARNEMVQLRAFAQSTLKQDLMDLKAQLPQ